MAKIDITKIEGFDSMSAEDKVQALLNAEVAPESQSNTVEDKYKALLSKANSEAADFKRKWQSTLSEQEKANAEREEAEKAKDALIASLQREKKVSTYKSSYLAMGYSEELAAKSAEAITDGNLDEVVAIQRLVQDAAKKQWEADALRKQPGLTGGTPPKGAEALDSLSDADYYKAISKN